MVSLLELKALLRERGTVKQCDLANHFRTTELMIATMCEKLQEKGVVAPVMLSCGCCTGGCEGVRESNCGGATQTKAWRFIQKNS